MGVMSANAKRMSGHRHAGPMGRPSLLPSAFEPGLRLDGMTPRTRWRLVAKEWLTDACRALRPLVQLGEEEGKPALSVQLHPAAEPLKVVDEGRGRVRLRAPTATVGPGYHRFVCRLSEALAEQLDLRWVLGEEGDPTGYFRRRDEGALHAAFDDWLAELASSVVDGSLRTPFPQRAHVGLPVGRTFLPPATLVSVLGPRDEDWVCRAAGGDVCARDILPWWSASLDATYYRNRALCRLWVEIPWRGPQTDDERAALTDALECLAVAHQQEVTLPLPFREWRELMLYARPIDRDLLRRVEKRAAEQTGELVGYRRQSVRWEVGGGWSVQLPGSFGEDEALADDGSIRFVDGNRTAVIHRDRRGDALDPRKEVRDVLGEHHEALAHRDFHAGATRTSDPDTGDVMQIVAATRQERIVIVLADPEMGDGETSDGPTGDGWMAQAWSTLSLEGAAATTLADTDWRAIG